MSALYIIVLCTTLPQRDTVLYPGIDDLNVPEISRCEFSLFHPTLNMAIPAPRAAGEVPESSSSFPT